MKDKSLLREVTRSKYKGSIKIGQSFGYWEIADEKLYTVTFNNKGAVYIAAKCIGCGDIHYMQMEAMRLAKATDTGGCRSCARIRNTPKGNAHCNWKGVGEMPKSYVNNLIAAANRRGLEFNVSMEYMWELFLNQNRKCKISGVDLGWSRYGRRDFRDGSASLDRIDSKLPYIEGNVQWVHKIVNEMKWAKNDAELIEWCKIIAEYNKH